MNLRRTAPWMLLALLVAFLGWKLHTSHFDWAGFARSWRNADLKLIALATLSIYSGNLLRAIRWTVFLKPANKLGRTAPIHWWSLVGPQFIGFAALAIFGRLGELVRPLLVARRTKLKFSAQVAVVAVERVFDLGAFAILFSLNLLLSPTLQTLPYHESFHKIGYVVAGLTLFLIVFVASVRLAGGVVAKVTATLVGLVSKPAGASAAEKILAFREGLNVIDNATDFALAAALSLILWATIAVAYILVMRAFPAPVHDLTISHILVMMGFSVVGGIVQLPGVGGGTQVGTISALTMMFRIPQELAVSAGLILWLVTNMAVVPAGLLFAKLEGISLRAAAHGSEDAEDKIVGAA